MLRPGRFDEIVEIPLPAESDRIEILKVHLRGKPVATGISVQGMASRMREFSGAEIASVCNRAALKAVRRVVEALEGAPSDEAEVVMEAEDFEQAISEIRLQGKKQPGSLELFKARGMGKNYG